ncbi:MAG: basic amino acid/polyamine antiporter, family [Blastocatellia bacterium]|jgi:APA family basic amino acid/polyamine antiporter|nr:basic amino acid/polyamine antiporter, family [Blastocatellia bacterium]
MNAPKIVEQGAARDAPRAPKLARRLGLFDATMIVMGGIIGSGIFINPYVVARQVHTPFMILGAWLLGGLIALAGAFIYAELAARRPHVGGQYAYLREAYHPSVAFIYGWALLLVTQTGGMAAVAVTFSRYFLEITRAPVPDWLIAVIALGLLTIINCLGVRAGSSMQNLLMVLKIVAIAALIVCGLFFVSGPANTFQTPLLDRPVSVGLLTAMGAAMTPVMFAYGGWQTASFVAGEMTDPRRDLARGLLVGVMGVILLYMAVNFVCLYALGPDALAATETPASTVMRKAFGQRGGTLIAIGIAISTLGFLSQGMLTAPRVYFAMAEDGLFFKSVAWLDPRTRVPVLAIALQGLLAVIIALSGKYEQILNYVVSVDFIWFGLTAASIFVFRHRAKEMTDESKASGYNVPGHPLTTALFVLACALIVVSTINKYPANSAIGLVIVVAGIPVYFFWRWWRRHE